ncbi:hypothetical protein FPZ12_024130 [Amycolatopsis acidicola]|uniref:Uncharacterized protein n=1 Tax=Amycolatopsis acidicola TaxID=2596893 RepID=A0A5N0UZ56_9PSEU|nr:hypothetical protein [Amycolatopsis acidicola]KAA9157973.1 hypothetical protein FPZ12_024130 [Amycolatopsis acidicola]
MASAIQEKHGKSIDRIVSALDTQPPRVRTALAELRRVFRRSGENPPVILAACATLLHTDQAITPDILGAVRAAAAEWCDYGDRERELFRACVHTSESRAEIAVTEPGDVTAMLREAPPRVRRALDGLRWLDAATEGKHRATYTVCATLLKNPSATHPAIVDAIQTGYRLWPTLGEDHRDLLIACIYASKERATHARRRAAAREKQREAESGDIHRCRNCDGNLASTPELEYCSDACRHHAEDNERPSLDNHTAAPAHAPFEERAKDKVVLGEIETQYDEQYAEIEPAIPSAGLVLKDERATDNYEDERQRHQDTDTDDSPVTDLTGHALTDTDYERLALQGIDPDTLCVACNLARTPTEYRRDVTDRRCESCRECDAPPLSHFAPQRELATAA